MLINIQSDKESVTSGVETAQMQFDTTKQAKLFHMLSSSLYSDKPASIIRELCSNCHDSHIMAGKTDIPFTLVGPTFEHPFLTVKDTGVGLTAEDAVKTILCYLGSNKDTSDEFIGGWGIGSKSPFAYAKNYQVITVKNGMRAEFACWKDEHGLPSQALLDHSPTAEPNGVEIIVPVEPEDIRRFAEAIANYMAWTNYNVSTTVSGMNIKRREPVERVDRGDAYSIELFGNGDGNIRLVYGGQSYKMDDCVDDKYDYGGDWKKLQEASSNEYDIAIIIHKPGSIDFNMNREELEQTDKTRNFVREVVGYLSEEGTRHASMYADELLAWNTEMKTKVVTNDAGEDVPATTSLQDVDAMIEKALARGNNSDRFFGKAFRVFDQKLRYDLTDTCYKLTQFSGVQRAHTINLVIAELHTQFEFVFGRIMGLYQAQRRKALSMTTRKEVIYVKAADREEFDKWIAANNDFKHLDMDKFRVTFFDIPKEAYGRSASSKPQPPRIYDAIDKRYLPYSPHTSYVMVTAEEKANVPAVIKLIRGEGSRWDTVLFVPTVDFKKRPVKPDNVHTLLEFIEKRGPSASRRVEEVRGYNGRRLARLQKTYDEVRNLAGGNLPPLLAKSAEDLASHLSNRIYWAETMRAAIGELEFATLGPGKTRKTLSEGGLMIKELRRVTSATTYLRMDRLNNRIDRDPQAKEIAASMDILKYFKIKEQDLETEV